MKKKLLYSIIMVLCLLFTFNLVNNDVNAISIDSVMTKLRTNSSARGEKFRVGIMENFYEVNTVENKETFEYEHIRNHRFYTTNYDSPISFYKNGYLPKNYTVEAGNIVCFEKELPEGYEHTLLYLLSLEDKSKTNINNNDYKRQINIKAFKPNEDVYTCAIRENTSYYAIETNHKYVSTYLVGDIIKVKVNIRQYQLWWFNAAQTLYNEDVYAYIILNIHEEIAYR